MVSIQRRVRHSFQDVAKSGFDIFGIGHFIRYAHKGEFTAGCGEDYTLGDEVQGDVCQYQRGFGKVSG